MINMLKIFYYILIKLFIIGIFYFVVSKLSYEIDFNEDYTRNVGFSPIWKLHKENNWICVNTSNKDLTEDYHKGLCSINIGAEKSVYFIGDSHNWAFARYYRHFDKYSKCKHISHIPI